jgi:hypothetical protein
VCSFSYPITHHTATAMSDWVAAKATAADAQARRGPSAGRNVALTMPA